MNEVEPCPRCNALCDEKSSECAGEVHSTDICYDPETGEEYIFHKCSFHTNQKEKA